MDNIAYSLYYTFSTIPQVLANSMALLAAFLLYRFKSIDDEFDNVLNNMRGFVPMYDHKTTHGNEIWKLGLRGRYKEVVKYLSKNKPESEEDKKEFDPRYDRLKEIQDLKELLMKWLFISFLLTCAIIIFSIYLLPSIHTANNNSINDYFLNDKFCLCIKQCVFIGIVGVVLCLSSYCWIVYKALSK